MEKKTTRRNLIRYGLGLSASTGIILCAAALPGFARGFRFPVLQYEPGRVGTSIDLPFARVNAKEATVVHQQGNPRLRASGLNPTIVIDAAQAATVDIEIENVHPRALAEIKGSALSESGEGLTRRITGTLSANETTRVEWRLREQTDIRFVVIGDTGGNRELQWSLQRAKQLDAEFVIHLGDIYYGETDSQTAPLILNQSPVPVFTAIGNHDFHDGFNLIHRQFTDTIGPRNSFFDVAHMRFVNIDTAAATFPVSSAQRGDLLARLQSRQLADPSKTTVVFTHAPLSDPRPPVDGKHFSHTVSDNEIPWLREQLAAINTSTLLAGHIHFSYEIDEQGIDCYIAGEGLAHHDLNYKKQIARILVGTIEQGNGHTFQWQPLLMPIGYHCSERVRRIIKANNLSGEYTVCSAPYPASSDHPES